MLKPLLQTKLHVPAGPTRLVARPRLITRLNEGLPQKMTLVSAPAGFGKTTLVGAWATGCGHPVSWLSLDESDNDPSQFLAYLAAALQTINAGLGARLLTLLRSPQPLPVELFLTSLINESASNSQKFILVLDDYHLIETEAIHDALTFLLDHLPPQMHLAMTSRSDPPLPLARLRARGKLTELRDADLRFTPDEAATFLNQAMGLDLSVEAISSLEARTEGWIAGLQLAALSLQGHTDPARFIRDFAGSHRFIVDYLIEEVLQRQPESVRSFLLQTAILDRLHASLCDAVWAPGNEGAAQSSGKRMLQTLERGNLFLIPLDEQRRWYRYHHLFAEVLQTRLLDEHPEQVPILHRRASQWYQQNSFPSQAIHHALAGQDWDRAAGLIEQAWPAVRRIRQESTFRNWVQALPGKMPATRPVLSTAYAWALIDGGRLEEAATSLQAAEQCLDAAAEIVVADAELFRALPASIANARAAHAQARGDRAGTMAYARQALELVRDEDDYERGTAAALLGLAHWSSGELEAAYQTFADGVTALQRAGGLVIATAATSILVDIRKEQGRLREAIRTCEQSLQLAAEHGDAPLQGVADLYLALADLRLEQGAREDARQHLRRSEQLGEQTVLSQYRWRLVQARLQQAQGDLDGALELLDKAQRLYQRTPLPDVRPVATLKARLWLAQGRLDDARNWADTHDLSFDDELGYLREFGHLTLARVLLAHYRREGQLRSLQHAQSLLERLLQAAEEGQRKGSLIEILMLQALAHEAQEDIAAARAPLERALALAEPEGYVQIFVDEGRQMARLLREMLTHGNRQQFAAKLLAAFASAEPGNRDASPSPTSEPPQLPVDPLTTREQDVLRLLATPLSGPEIARELGIALSTVRSHTKNIYGKLNVHSRRAVVNRATELGLL